MGREFLFRSICHGASHQAKEAMWDFFMENGAALGSLLESQEDRGGTHYKSIRRRAQKYQPDIEILEVTRGRAAPHAVTRRVGTSLVRTAKSQREEERLFMEARITVRK
jgi:hypothetical protein